MQVPDFRRAEYNARPIEGEVVGKPVRGDGRLLPALLAGLLAAALGSVGYALVGLSGFMVSIVAIGIGWLVAKAMMTVSGGVGGRPYQVAAVVLTYFAVTFGEVWSPLWRLHRQGVPLASLLANPIVVRLLLLGPLLRLNGINGILGLLILFFGLRAAWQFAAGGPGFGGGRRIGPFGLR